MILRRIIRGLRRKLDIARNEFKKIVYNVNLLSTRGKVPSYIYINPLEQYKEQVEVNYSSLSNHFSIFMKLIEEINSIPDSEILPLCKFSEKIKSSQGNQRLFGLRFDVDADPFTAIKCARYLAYLGLSGSFFFLHTSPYYSTFSNSVVLRRPEMKDILLQVSGSGNEVGLHIDPFGAYKFFGLEGYRCIQDEINYIRSLGLTLRGVVAHNSAPVYGAENFEIFRELVLFPRSINLGRHKVKLGLTSLSELGLEYEGTFTRPSKNFSKSDFKKYLKVPLSLNDPAFLTSFFNGKTIYERDLDAQLWIIGRDKWLLATKDTFKEVSLQEATTLIRENKQWRKILLVLHPEYFSRS